MKNVNLIEAGTVLSEDPSEDGTWRVRVIDEGLGSSGYYAAERLETYHHAFDYVVSFLNHPVSGAEARNFTEIAGRVVGETWLDTAEDGTLGVYANWRPDPDYKAKLETYKDSLGLSIYISGAGEDRDGVFHVTEFDTEDPFRSVDVVIAAGRGGRFEMAESMRKIYESRRDSDEKPSVTSAREERKLVMEKDVEERFAALETLLTKLVAKDEAKAAEAAQVEADAAAKVEAVEAYDAAVKAIDEADLLPSQVAALRAEAKKGADVAPLIEAAKQVKADALASIQESADEAPAGRIVESASKTFKIGAWK